MAAIQAPTRLYLQYRLWIAEMNADLTVLRIFDDHCSDLDSPKNSPALKNTLENFNRQFASVRKEIDELKHEMHLVKMKLAAGARNPNAKPQKSGVADNHPDLKRRYDAFRKNFDKIKKEFTEFEPGS